MTSSASSTVTSFIGANMTSSIWTFGTSRNTRAIAKSCVGKTCISTIMTLFCTTHHGSAINIATTIWSNPAMRNPAYDDLQCSNYGGAEPLYFLRRPLIYCENVLWAPTSFISTVATSLLVRKFWAPYLFLSNSSTDD